MHRYAIALGSNRMSRHGPPARTLRAAIAALERAGPRVAILSPILATPALGPAGRAFANAAALIETPLAPPALLALLKRTERAFGRRPGRRWGPRALDLDILLWSGGRWRSARPRLIVPHPALPARAFVLDPLACIAPGWRVPPRGRTVAQLRHRLHARKVDRRTRAP